MTIAAGTFTLYDGDDPTCTGHSYTAGQAFVDIGSRIDVPDPGNC